MKKIILPFILFIITSVSCEQKFETWQIPKEVVHNFEKQHPHISPDWEIEDSVFEATFTSGGEDVSLLYNKAGNLLQTENIIKTSAVPVTIKNYLAKNKKDQEVTKAKKVTKDNGEVNYNVMLDRQRLTFTEEGKLIKMTNH